MTHTPNTLTANERWIQEQEHVLHPTVTDREFFGATHTMCRVCGPGPLGREEIPSKYDHVFKGDVVFADEYGSKGTRLDKVSKPSDADVVTSEVEGTAHHTVMLDIDMPARLIASSTPEHFHLYIDHLMSWREYKRLLRAMYRVRLIEKGFYKASVRRKATHLRVPWKDKEV